MAVVGPPPPSPEYQPTPRMFAGGVALARIAGATPMSVKISMVRWLRMWPLRQPRRLRIAGDEQRADTQVGQEDRRGQARSTSTNDQDRNFDVDRPVHQGLLSWISLGATESAVTSSSSGSTVSPR